MKTKGPHARTHDPAIRPLLAFRSFRITVPVRIRLQLDAGLLMLMSLVAVVMPSAEDDGAQQHARNEENELPEAVSPCPAVPEDLGQQGMKRDEEKGGGGGGKRKGQRLTREAHGGPPRDAARQSR